MQIREISKESQLRNYDAITRITSSACKKIKACNTDNVVCLKAYQPLYII